MKQHLKTSNGAVNNMSSSFHSQSLKKPVRSNSHHSTNFYGGKTIKLGLLIFLALINFRLLFDLIVRPNICLKCMFLTRNLNSRLIFLLVCSSAAYPIPTATLIGSVEIITNIHRKQKEFPIETLYLTLFLVFSLLLQAEIALFLLFKVETLNSILNRSPLIKTSLKSQKNNLTTLK